MENRIPALSLGFGSSWTCWTGWICFSLLDLFRSSPLLKPKEFKCPAGACAPPPLSRLLSSIFSSNEASLQISISWNTQSWLFKSPPLEKGSQRPQRTAWCFISGWASSGMSVCDWSLQRYCHTDTPAAVCCLLKPLTDMQTWCQSPDHWWLSLGLFVHHTIIPWFLLLPFFVSWCFYFCDVGDWTHVEGNTTIRLYSQPSAL